MTNDKEILYNIIRREVGNLTRGNSFLALFENYIAEYVLEFIDPYVNAFMSKGQLMTDKATGYLKQEVLDKIDSFKANYEQEKDNEENK